MTDAIADETRAETVDQIAVLEEKIARCHRLASQTTDDKLCAALERLAREYEAELPRERRRRSFMLGR